MPVPATPPTPPPVATPAAATPAARKRGYRDARELEQLPARIERLETEIAARVGAMHAPEFFQQDSAAIIAANEALAGLQAELDAAYARWDELESP